MNFKQVSKLKTAELKVYLENLNSKEIARLMKECVRNYPVDVKKWTEKNNKKACKRLRTRSVLFGKLAKAFRAKSIAEIKQNEFVH
jgi:hypothetical protein